MDIPEPCKYPGPAALDRYAQQHILNKKMTPEESSEYLLVVLCVFAALVAGSTTSAIERKHILTQSFQIIQQNIEELVESEKKSNKTASEILAGK